MRRGSKGKLEEGNKKNMTKYERERTKNMRFKNYWVVARYYEKRKELSIQDQLKGCFRVMEFLCIVVGLWVIVKKECLIINSDYY